MRCKPEMKTSILFLFSIASITADVIFTSERCSRADYGLQIVVGDPSRYKQCGPSGRVWIVPCAPEMTFHPVDKVCREREQKIDTSFGQTRRAGSSFRSLPTSTTHSPVEEFVFSTKRPRRPKRPRPKTKTKTKTRTKRPKIRKTTVVPTVATSTSEVSSPIRQTTSAAPTVELAQSEVPHQPAFPAPGGRHRTTTEPPNNYSATPKSEPTIQPEYTVKYNGVSMTEQEFLTKLMMIVKNQKEEKEAQKKEEEQRIREKEEKERAEKEREQEKQRQIETALRERERAEKERLAELAEKEKRVAEKKRILEERREKERREQEKREEMERIAKEMEEKKRAERQRLLREREEMELAEKKKQEEIARYHAERARLAREKEEERRAEIARNEEILRKQAELREAEKERKRIEKQRRIEVEMAKEVAEREEQERREAEKQRKARERAAKLEEIRREAEKKEREELAQQRAENERIFQEREKKKRIAEKLREIERQREAEKQRKEKDRLEQERREMEALIATERNFNRLGTGSSSLPSENPIFPQTELPRATNEIIRFPPQPEPKPFRFTAPPAPEAPSDVWVTSENSWRPPVDWEDNQVEQEQESAVLPSTRVVSGCLVNGDCPLDHERDLLCSHPDDPSAYLQCAPLFGRKGRWTERFCPQTLVFVESLARCEKSTTKPYLPETYNPERRVVIPRLPSETDIVQWTGNRVIDHASVQAGPARPEFPPWNMNRIRTTTAYPAYPPRPSMYHTIDAFPRDLLPTMSVRTTTLFPTIRPIPNNQYYGHNREIESVDLAPVRPLFPRVEPSFLSRFLPFQPMRDEERRNSTGIGSVVKPVIKKIALDQTRNFLDRLLANEQVNTDTRDRLRAEGAEKQR